MYLYYDEVGKSTVCLERQLSYPTSRENIINFDFVFVLKYTKFYTIIFGIYFNKIGI